MQFRTQIPILKSNHLIAYHSKIVTLGSCFATNMATKLDYYKFQNTSNPFGIIFNPVSIEKVVERAINSLYYTEKDIFFHNNLWHSFEVHSELSNSDKTFFLDLLNGLIDSTKEQITRATHFQITYGTSWVYRENDSNSVVANCHKIPQKQFSKELLSIETIQQSVVKTIQLVQSVNPEAKFIFTVSPVRHIKDGFVENQVSKAHLIAAIYTILSTEDCKHNAKYFPSYEIMMDELRDYRFYNADMLHPNQVAIDYIWEQFSQSNIAVDSHATMEAVATIQKSLQHRAFNIESDSHHKFQENLKSKITKMVSQYSFMKF